MNRLRIASVFCLLSLSMLLAACASPPAAESTESADAVASPLAAEPTQAQPTASPAPSLADPAPLAIVYRHGGMCITGGECQWTLTIFEDGSYNTFDGTEMKAEGTLTDEQMTQLRDLIAQTDFDAIRAVPFTGDCPTAYDGQEVIYTLSTDHGQEVLASCEVVIDASIPLIAVLDQLAIGLTAIQ